MPWLLPGCPYDPAASDGRKHDSCRDTAGKGRVRERMSDVSSLQSVKDPVSLRPENRFGVSAVAALSCSGDRAQHTVPWVRRADELHVVAVEPARRVIVNGNDE